MKKTTWIIIGLSVCVVVLATALGIVLLQNKAEIPGMRAPESDTSSQVSNEVRQMIDSFYIAPHRSEYPAYYPYVKAYVVSALLKKSVIVGHNNYMYGVPVRGKGLTVYQNGNVYTYVVSKEKLQE